jgi:hypothetical protein
LQTLPSLQEVPAAIGVCATPPTGLHESVVHGLPSSTTTGTPDVQWPPVSQVSRPLQAFASSQKVETVTAMWMAPVAGLHASMVQGLPSSSVGGVPATQEPAALHVSSPLQASPSEHDAPATGVCVAPVAGLHASSVHGFPSSIASGGPPMHAPAALQASMPLHTFPSEQDVPALAGVWVGPPGASQVSTVHGLPSSQLLRQEPPWQLAPLHGELDAARCAHPPERVHMSTVPGSASLHWGHASDAA